MKNLKIVFAAIILSIFILKPIQSISQGPNEIITKNTFLYENSENLKIPWAILIGISIDFGQNTVINNHLYPCINSGICKIHIGKIVENPSPDESYIGLDKNKRKILIIGKYDLMEFSRKGYDSKSKSFILPEDVKIEIKITNKKIPNQLKKPIQLKKGKVYKVKQIEGYNVVYLD